ncbi:MAG: PD-(D/E)XK motif protein [Burkholderiales bacterium]|nr:PD-(D/E)XK motif protein [Burkholderiales bacterium]
MTIDHLPWWEIQMPASEINRLRVDRSHPYDFFWGKDVSGHCLLLLRFDAALLDDIKIRKIILTGITTDIRAVPDAADGVFLITLQNTENADIFFTLCEALVKKTRDASNVHAAIAVIYSQLERWRTLLSSARHNRLSAQEVQGLFGELQFLEECIDGQHVSIQAAIEGWQGPKGAPHDFIFGQSAVEIKSISGSYTDSVKISTESQLTTHLETLHLRIVFLAVDTDCKTGLSLNDFIIRLKGKIADSDLVSTFEEKLVEVGYIDIPEYDFPCFSVVRTRTYEVGDGFPRITPESLARGISDVSYCIAFSSISEYICDSFIPGSQK